MTYILTFLAGFLTALVVVKALGLIAADMRCIAECEPDLIAHIQAAQEQQL